MYKITQIYKNGEWWHWVIEGPGDLYIKGQRRCDTKGELLMHLNKWLSKVNGSKKKRYKSEITTVAKNKLAAPKSNKQTGDQK